MFDAKSCEQSTQGYSLQVEPRREIILSIEITNITYCAWKINLSKFKGKVNIDHRHFDESKVNGSLNIWAWIEMEGRLESNIMKSMRNYSMYSMLQYRTLEQNILYEFDINNLSNRGEVTDVATPGILTLNISSMAVRKMYIYHCGLRQNYQSIHRRDPAESLMTIMLVMIVLGQ